MNDKRWLVRVVCVSLVVSWSLLGCNDNSSTNSSSDHGFQFSDSKIASFDGGIASSDSSNNLDSGSANDLSIDQNSPCTPDCTGRVCGPDPLCGMSCGPACTSGQCNSQGQCATASSSWAIKAGGPSDDYGRSIARDSSGNALVTGWFYGQATIGGTVLSSNGDSDIFVAKVSPSGDVLWAINIGGPYWDGGKAIAVDASDNVLVTGEFTGQVAFGNTTLISEGQNDTFSDIFVAKISPSGDVLWALGGGGADYDYPDGITVDSNGNALIAGTMYYLLGKATFGGIALSIKGNSDVFVAKISPSGDVIWAITAGGTNWDYSNDIAVDGSGNAFITGAFIDETTFGSTTLYTTGDYMDYDLFIAKVSSSGEMLWAIDGGGDKLDEGKAIVVDSNDNAIVTGDFQGQATLGTATLSSKGDRDIFVAKVSPSGVVRWVTTGGGSGLDESRGIALDTSGDAVMTGDFKGQATFGNTTLSSNGDTDIFMVQVSSSGDMLSASSEGGSDEDKPFGLALDGSGNVLLTGIFSSQATLGGTALTSSGKSDIFVAKVPMP